MSTAAILHMSDLPVLQNRVYSTRDSAITCPRGDIRLVQDPKAGFVRNNAFQPERIRYDTGYQNEQGHSAVFTRHLQEVAGIVEHHFQCRKILEIGCGKGMFLEILRDRNMDVTGIDPAYEGSASYIVCNAFSPAFGFTGDAIILRHVLEHVNEPLKFLEEISEANGGRGLIYIEVPCLEWIGRQRAWFDIYYEHVNYFRLPDFYRVFGTVIESGKLFGGQYLYVIADLSTLGTAEKPDKDPFTFPSDFLSGIDIAIDIINTGRKKRHVIWGAASKGVLFALHLGRNGKLPDFAIDINPAKQGKFMPASGLPVLSPEEGIARMHPKDTIFIMNPNYMDEIRSLAGTDYEYILT